MVSRDSVREMALALDGVTEIDHWGRPAFRTKKRIFAVIRSDGLYLHLPEERKEFLFAAAPTIFVKYMWGRTANVIVQTGRVPEKDLASLMREAHAYALPQKKHSRLVGAPSKMTRKRKGG